MYFSFPSAVILLLASLVLSKAINQSPLHIAASNDGQSVLVHTRRQGSFQGNRLQHVDEFLAIPYAEKPIGHNRLARTVPLKRVSKSAPPQDATKPGNICIQPPSTDSTPDQNQSEDCLVLNIYRPQGLKPGHKVPVMVWLYGGSWQEGSIFEPRLNASKFVTRSMQIHEPVIFVAPNYRVGAFGFLAGSAVVDAESEGLAVRNAGLYDQQEALRWVQRTIEAFGGDPSRVTLMGQSAGAASVGAQILADNGRGGSGLFRAAILESGGAATGRRLAATDEEPEEVFHTVLHGAGCSNTSTLRKQIQCLKLASTAHFTQGNNATFSKEYIGYQPVLDEYFVRQPPSEQLESGRYLHVPFIAGTTLDEGTEFPYPLDVVNDDQFKASLKIMLGKDTTPITEDILRTWSSDPSEGCPYRPDFYGASPNDTFYPPLGKNQFKRQAAVVQDVYFEAGRRMQLSAAMSTEPAIPAWSYQFAQPSPVETDDASQIASAVLGVQHEAEIPFVFADPPLQGGHSDRIPEPLRTFASDKNLTLVANIMSAAWIHFANRMDPNGEGVPWWPAYHAHNHSSAKKVSHGYSLYIQGGNTTMIPDNYRLTQTDFVLQNKHYFHI